MPQCLLKPPHGIIAYEIEYRRDLESMKEDTMACSVGSLNIEHPNQLPLRFFQFCLVRPHNDGVYPISPSGASISDQESFATLDFISFVIIE